MTAVSQPRIVPPSAPARVRAGRLLVLASLVGPLAYTALVAALGVLI